MALEIIWTKNAQEQLADTIVYLQTLGNEQLLQRFSRQLEGKLQLIKDHPQLYQKSDQLEGARRCVVNKYYSLLYSYDRVFVYVLSLLDNRSRPESW